MRNSVVELRVVVLTLLVDVDVDVVVEEVGLACVCAAVEDVVLLIGVAAPLVGPELGGCCRSLACSVIRAGASFWRLLRIWGTIEERTRSLTGSFAELGLKMSMSNWPNHKGETR